MSQSVSRLLLLLGGALVLVLGPGQLVGASGSWEAIGPWGGEMNCLVQAPLDPNVLFAGCIGLYKSTDGGATWQKLAVWQQRNVSCVAAAGAGEGLVATASGRKYPVFVSTDGGDTWGQVQEEVFAKNEVYHLSFTSHGPDGGSLVACTTNGLFASSDGLSGWQKVGEGIPTTTTTAFFTCSAPDRPRYFFVCGQNCGVYRSEQLESGWGALAIPHPEDVVWRVGVQWDDRRNVFASGDAGLFKSTDGGSTWDAIWAQDTSRVTIASSAPTVVYAAGQFGLAISPDSGVSWQTRQDGLVIGSYVTGDLVVSSQSPLAAWLASRVGIYRTEDAGGSWYPSNHGISAWGIDNIEASDRVPGLVFAKCVTGLLRKTQDTDWELLGASGTTIELNPEWIALDPSDDATLYAWTGSKLIRSHDMGNDGTWETVLEPGPGAYGLAIDHDTGQNIYLATGSRGVMVSRDGGESWEESNSGLPENARWVNLISIAPSDSDVLWIGIGDWFGAKDVCKTTDAARSWATATSIRFSVNCITIDPSDADVVYLGTGFGGNGVEKTSDGGAIFLPLSEGLTCTCVNDIAIDPKDARIVYAATGMRGSSFPGAGLYALDSATGLEWNWIECPGVDPIGLYAIGIDPWAEDRVLCAFAGNSLLAHDKTVRTPIEISLSTDQSQYGAGDTQIARISATNSGGDIDVDLYIAIMLPDGSLLFWPDFGSLMHPGFSMTPMPRGFSMTDVVFFNMALPSGLPGGGYTWFGIFYGQATQNAVSNLASAEWTFQP
ncbi:MAG: hypothetical protein JW759_08055 [Candidatus Coatesbacteria bacterium]|nr:hypothetical protein [Candidatus Coatesbacteria bacterium]